MTNVESRIEYHMVYTKDEIQESFVAVMNPKKEHRMELIVCEVNNETAPICVELTEFPEVDIKTIWLSPDIAIEMGAYMIQKAMNIKQKKAISDEFGESYAKL